LCTEGNNRISTVGSKRPRSKKQSGGMGTPITAKKRRGIEIKKTDVAINEGFIHIQNCMGLKKVGPKPEVTWKREADYRETTEPGEGWRTRWVKNVPQKMDKASA